MHVYYFGDYGGLDSSTEGVMGGIGLSSTHVQPTFVISPSIHFSVELRLNT